MQFGVSESVKHWGIYRPNSTAVYHNSKTISFRTLNCYINALCHELNKKTLTSDRIAVAIESKLYLLVSIISILRVGKSVVLLNMKLPKEALHTNIKDTGVISLIHDKHHEYLISFIDSPEKSTFSIDDKFFKATIDSAKSQSFDSSIVRYPPDEWGIVFSSGTTGIPKGIERDHNSIVTELLGWCLELNFNRNTSFYIGRPLLYTGGILLSLSTLLVGGSIFINDYNDDNDYYEIWSDYQKTLANYSISWAFFIPDQIRVFTRIAEESTETLRGADTILIMGSPITGDEKLKAASTLNSKIVESWGNSESLGTITDPEDVLKRPNSIGRPFLTDEMYIVNDDGIPLKPGQYGRIAGSEEAGFLQYSGRPEDTKRVKRNELIISDDIGYLDEDRYLYICGRRQDCIVTDKEALFLPDLEAKLRSINYVHECCVVSKSQGDTTFELIAVIVLAPNTYMNDAEILDQLNKQLEPIVQFNNVVIKESLPRLPSGKVDKVAIEKMLEKD